MTDVVLRVEGLRKAFGEVLAVDGLSIDVQRGEILGFLGPNGAGKTTALRMMCGLLRPDGGTILLDGQPILPGDTRALAHVGVAPQALVVWETLTAFEHLELMAEFYGLTRARSLQRAGDLLAAFGLTAKAHALGRTLSGGMQRRLNIALAFVHEPTLAFLDEPQAGLDPQSRVLVRDFLRSVKGRCTVVLTTHDMEEVEKLADRVCIVDRGRLLVLDTVAAVKRGGGSGPVTMVPREPTLEDAFIRLTGRRLRE